MFEKGTKISEQEKGAKYLWLRDIKILATSLKRTLFYSPFLLLMIISELVVLRLALSFLSENDSMKEFTQDLKELPTLIAIFFPIALVGFFSPTFYFPEIMFTTKCPL